MSTYQIQYEVSDADVQMINFARLKNVSISYQLPSRWINGTDGRIYLQGQNLFTITNFRGQDPETGSALLPPLATLVAGIQINL
jgi:hypothetical protein